MCSTIWNRANYFDVTDTRAEIVRIHGKTGASPVAMETGLPRNLHLVRIGQRFGKQPEFRRLVVPSTSFRE